MKPAKPMTIAISEKVFALGMSTGKIIVYDDVTCQESQILAHQEPVWCLAIGDTGRYLASSGAKSIRVWDPASWSELFKFAIPQMCMALNFYGGWSLTCGNQE
jgi:WD40 repeat protein